MIEFKVSAPGKITLLGEHAYLIKNNKTTVLASSIHLRTTLKFTELLDQNVIKIEFSHENLSLNIPFKQVSSFFGGEEEFDHDRLRMMVNGFVTLELGLKDQINLKVKVVLYLLISIAQREQIAIKSFHVHVNSELPPMSGESLGNTMSSTVCLAACFLHWSRLQKNICYTGFDADHLEKISKYATECENFIHTCNIMPGIDARVCTYGWIIEFHPDRVMNVFVNVPNMKILLVDTNDSKTIANEMNNIHNLNQDYREIADSIATSVEAVTESACQFFRNFSSNIISFSDLYINLGHFMTINQGLICTLDVLYRNLDTLSSVMMQYPGMTWKYTHGDCGRFAYILLPLNAEIQFINEVSEKILTDLSYTVTMVNLGCHGVRIE